MTAKTKKPLKKTVKAQAIAGITLRIKNLYAAYSVKGLSKQWYDDHRTRIDELDSLLGWIKSLK